MGRPPKFSRQRLQDAALALVDEQGVAALSMRSLAGVLGTGAMTIYNHVADRSDLEVLVVEAVVAEIRLPHRRRDDWQDEVREVATAMWRGVRAHPNVIPLILTRRSRSTAALEVAEMLLAALARSGRSGRRLLIAFRAVSAFVMGFAQAELAGPLAVAAGEKSHAVLRRIRKMPRERFPRLIEIATAAATSAAEREFRQALDVLIAGLAIALPSRARRAPRASAPRTSRERKRSRSAHNASARRAVSFAQR